MTGILPARMPQDRQAILDLFSEYLRWACQMILQEYRAVFKPEEIIVRDMENIYIFMPPKGFLLLAFEEDMPAGCACVKAIGKEVAELKRMYVRPTFRRKGIGKQLVAKTIDEVTRQNYAVLKLDSAGFMTDAHALYRSFGFTDIRPYEESEIPEEFRKYWVFMELQIRK
jgi:GNAT superfamily N-acetyltransferase